MSRERRSKLDPLSRIITLGDIECETVNQIIQDIYEINDEDRKKQTVEPIPQKRKTKGYIYEVYEYAKNQAKWKAAEEWCADRLLEFKIITENELGIN